MLTKISASLQDYLEAILELNGKEESVRVTDIARKLNIAKPSVNQTINKLKKLGLVSHESYGPVNLTTKGRDIAEQVRMRHKLLFDFLTKVIGVDSKTAEKEACLMEHVISDETMQKLSSYLESILSNNTVQ